MVQIQMVSNIRPQPELADMVASLPMAEPSGNVTQFYADCVGRIDLIHPGIMFRVIFCEIRTIGGVHYKVPILEVTRPLALFDYNHVGTLLKQAQASVLAGSN